MANSTLPAKYNLAEGETFTVRVYRDHEEWDRCDRWWKMPGALLVELSVCTYECSDHGQLAWIEKEHPGCVFVY